MTQCHIRYAYNMRVNTMKCNHAPHHYQTSESEIESEEIMWNSRLFRFANLNTLGRNGILCNTYLAWPRFCMEITPSHLTVYYTGCTVF